MGKKSLYKDLISVVQTDEDVIQLIDELESVGKELYKTDAVLETLFSSQISSRFFHPLQGVLRQTGVDSSQRAQVQNLLSSIITELRNLPVVHVTLAFDPTVSLIGEICQWLRENVAAESVMDISVDKKIIGGFLMDYNGRYWDNSIRSSFEKLSGGGNLIYLVNRNK